MSRCRGARSESGFTLLELLVALLLAGLLATTAFSGLNLGINSWQRIQSFQDDYRDIYLVQNVLRRLLENALEERIYDDDGVYQVAMRGDRSQLLFLASNPVYGAPGKRWLLLMTDQTEQGTTRLLLYMRPFEQFEQLNLDDFAEELVFEEVPLTLLEGDFEGLSLEYLNVEPDKLPDWTDEWLEQPRLPRLIRIDLEGEPPGFWHEMLATPKVLIYGIKQAS
ncbi:prepilin-type N-terminal cleavage/methylation domain-containing protein [Marinobacterium arenosum]|uniref:prepilin-type N-terminal cleavage/methylation domain-containing protein n=1 Tax=Marinobacterium arenosum TaxID=2862496 RepID=UPI001C961022|nr:prepilin-type N-terminal cleavage/methylation domain-containing protein [Marinobacterium arenosum]MBY4678553.1 prepilin-type N-terminal cleavage/methylation domain-containing protein [Marinobacterium arenosum]